MRLYTFLVDISESVIANAVKIESPKESQEYVESDVVKKMTTLIKAIKELKNKSNPSESDLASLADFSKNLRSWLSICKDRFNSKEIENKAELVISAGKPKKTTAPIDLQRNTMDIKVAAKTGALSPDPEVVKMLDKKEKEEEKEEEIIKNKQDKKNKKDKK